MVASMIQKALVRAVPLVGAVAAGSGMVYAEEENKSASKLSIYPEVDPQVQLVPIQTELERQIGSARKGLQSVTKDARQALHSGIEKWISVEKKVEGQVKSLISSDEPLTPGLLYVGVATLAGSVFTRFRAFPIRFITPPLLLVASLNYFQPKLSHNLAEYYESIEKAHAPALTEQRQSLINSARQAWSNSKQKVEDAKHGAEEGFKSGLENVEKSTGLKVGNVVSSAKEAKIKLEDQMKAV